MIKSRDLIFHEIENLVNLEKTEKSKDAIVGVPDLTPTSSSSNHATNREDVQDENLGDDPIAVNGDKPAGVDGDDAQDIEDVEQRKQLVPPEMEEPHVRRSTRERHPLTRYPFSEYILLTDKGEPEYYQEVQFHKDKQSWMKAMQEEMNSLHKNKTYEVELPQGNQALSNNWVFKLKKASEKLVKYKARLVVKGFSQKHGVDFDEILSPVVKMSSI